MFGNRKREYTGTVTGKPWLDWMLRHELLSSCGLTVALGLMIGGVAVLLEQILL